MLSNATTFRRIVAGLCLILAPLFLLISNLLQTRTPITTENLLDSITANAVANEISFAFALYGFTLMVPAVIGIIHLLRHRSVALGHIGGTFLILYPLNNPGEYCFPSVAHSTPCQCGCA
jgi:hypothetical protein